MTAQPLNQHSGHGVMTMNQSKRELLRDHISLSELARRIGVSRQAMSSAVSGKDGLSREVAARAASVANEVTGYHFFEVTDFNGKLPSSLKNVSDDVIVQVVDTHFMSKEVMSAVRVTTLYEDELEVVDALHLLVHDGEPLIVNGRYVLTLVDHEDLSDV